MGGPAAALAAKIKVAVSARTSETRRDRARIFPPFPGQRETDKQRMLCRAEGNGQAAQWTDTDLLRELVLGFVRR